MLIERTVADRITVGDARPENKDPIANTQWITSDADPVITVSHAYLEIAKRKTPGMHVSQSYIEVAKRKTGMQIAHNYIEILMRKAGWKIHES